MAQKSFLSIETINWKDKNYLLWSYITRTESVKTLLKILKKDFAKKLGERSWRKNYQEQIMSIKLKIPFDEIKKNSLNLREEDYTNLVLGHFTKP